MRIAICGDGRSPHTQRWANAVVERGHDVVLVWVRREFAEADTRSFHPSVSHVVHDPPSRRKLWKLPTARWEPRRLAARLQPDVVHGLSLSGHGWTAHAFGVQPLVLTALGSDVLELDGGRGIGLSLSRLERTYVARRTRAAVASADIVLADSTALADAVRARLPRACTRIVRFGVELREAAAGDGPAWRRRLRIHDDAFVLLSSRLLRPNYNIETIIRALPTIRAEIPSVVLVIKELPRFSDPSYRRRCLDVAAALGVADAIVTVGEVDRDDLLKLHSAADVFLSVPDTDGTAVSVLEAMAADVPVVATDAPGIDPVILRHEETALLVPRRDPAALAVAVLRLAREEQFGRRIAGRARDVVRRYADFDRELDRAVLLYEELVAEQRRHADAWPG